MIKLYRLNNNTSINKNPIATAIFYEPSIISFMGKINWTIPTHAITNIIPVLPYILSVYCQIAMCANILFIAIIICAVTICMQAFIRISLGGQE